MGRTRLNVCCIMSVEEARMAVAAGADAIALVSAMPSGFGVISVAAPSMGYAPNQNVGRIRNSC